MRTVHLLLIFSLSCAILHRAHSRSTHRGHTHTHTHPQPRPITITTTTTTQHAPTKSPFADMCSVTDFPDLCLSMTTPFAANHPNANYKSMLNMSVAALTAKTQDVATTISHIIADPHTPPLVASNLKDCQQGTSDGVDDLATAKTAVAGGDSDTALTDLSAFITDIENCRDSFEDRPTAQPNPVDGEITTLQHMADICLSFLEKAQFNKQM